MHHAPFSIARTLAALETNAPMQNVDSETAVFVSGGREISVEMFHPHDMDKAPAIVVLHGAGGMDHGNRYVRHLASAFAANGYATLLAHYFQSTGTSFANDAVIHANFVRWLEVVRDGVSFAAGHPKIDRNRVALFGYSLGAYLAVAHAAHDPRVGAVIELAGGVDPEFAASITYLPPTLIIHGTEDQRVHFARAGELEKLLQGVGAPYETRYYAGEGHILSPVAALDALGHGLEFLGRHLPPAAP